jgi:hypothetical protein
MPSCVADDAVWCEQLSASSSLMIRENTGNFRDFDPLEAGCSQKSLVFSWKFLGIPYSTEQGIILEEQRIFST